MEEDTIIIHLGRVVDEELYNEITQYIVDKLNEKYRWLTMDKSMLS